ncbi:nucleotidyltransferase domain-containing protein [Leptolyngbya sp. PCC 6406]|uniref:nucleotidyltransferase domain-containing protein n=1 Tax=Leptolyngbya sp. PCC 6406 TaxID=1173264 RepID=UPI0002AC7FD3|nr:nucleotidyltransferase domain-containing protein [Leptolyngbya sp. PCC 6406]
MKNPILDQVKQIIHQIEPEAEIILYGSRARGDATPESDWDFLVLLDGPVDAKRTDHLRHALYELEWDIGEVLTSIIRNRMEWQTPRYQASAFYQFVQKDGIML